jgi:N-glycosylase/DNA lyase
MKIFMDIDLDSTLGCGQAHRWCKIGDSWEGVLGEEVITLKQMPYGFDCDGTNDKGMILEYFRNDDDLESIYDACAKSDDYIAGLIDRCRGLRILKQPHYECIATYILATNANVKRIGTMVESVCRTFGKNLGARYSFPTPEEILTKKERISECRLGYRADRFVEFAQMVYDGRFDPDSLEEASYDSCVKALLTINGVGPKVADCIALFSYGHLEAFPIDTRISSVLKDVYGVEGSYKVLSQFAREKFGKFAGYSQEFLYHADFID